MQANIIQGAFARHAAGVEKSVVVILPDAEMGARLLAEAAKKGKRLFVCGNGGSAADAQHLAAEWLCRYKGDRAPLPAIALTVDASTLTAIGNDYGFEEVFARQLQALGNEGDVLVAITTSGKSKNIVRAIDEARKKHMKIIVLTGAGGEELRSATDVAVAVPLEETARIQEMHELVYHAWCEYVDDELSAKKAA